MWSVIPMGLTEEVLKMNELVASGGMDSALVVTIITVTLGGAVGWWLRKLIAPKGASTSADELGRAWAGWFAFWFCLSLSLDQRFFSSWNVAAFIALPIGGGIWIAFGYALGWAYGRFFKFRHRVNDYAVAATQSPENSVTQHVRGGQDMYCHQCGTKLPTGASFCASCGTKTVAAGPNDPDAKGLAPTATAPVATPTLPSQGSRGAPFQITDTPLAVVKPTSPSQGLRVLQHSVAIMLACLADPRIWKSPSLGYAFGTWLVTPVLSLGLAGLIAGIAFVFYPKKMKSIWPDVFIRTAWVVTGISLAGAYLVRVE